jgi:type I restriction enzyme S subunit
VDEKISNIDQQISATETLKKGLMQKLFTEGIGHTEFKSTEIGTLPKSWEVVKFIDMSELQRGHDLPINNRKKGIYPVIASNGQVGYHDEYKAKGPGVITGRSGSINNTTYVKENYWPLNTALYVKNFKGNYPQYIFYFFEQFDFSKFSTGTGVPTLNRNDVHPKLVPLPTFEEQEKITSVLTEVDNKIESLKKKKEKYTTLKTGLMQQLLTGQKRVKV